MAPFARNDLNLNTKSTAFRLLLEEEARHRGTMYYLPARVDHLFDQLSAAMNWVTTYKIDPSLPKDVAARYGPWTGSITFRPNGVPLDIMHELVRAVTDRQDWHVVTNAVDMESSAYSVQWILGQANNTGHSLALFSTKQFDTIASVSLLWKAAWANMESGVITNGTYYVGPLTYKMRPGDVSDAQQHVGLRFFEGYLWVSAMEDLFRRGVPRSWDLQQATGLSRCFE